MKDSTTLPKGREIFSELLQQPGCEAIASDFADIASCRPAVLPTMHPHIVENLGPLWGRPEAVSYLISLQIADRANRRGFSSQALAEIVFLQHLHEFLHPPAAGGLDASFEDLQHRATRPRTLIELIDRFGPPEAKAEYYQFGSEAPADSPTRPAGWGEIRNARELQDLVGNPRTFPRPRKRLGEVLVANAVITPEELQEALEQQQDGGGSKRLGEILRESRKATYEDIYKSLCVQEGFLLVDLAGVAMAHDAAALLSAERADEYGVVPLLKHGRNRLVMVVDEPLLTKSRLVVARLEDRLGLAIDIAWAPSAAIRQRHAAYFAGRVEKRT